MKISVITASYNMADSLKSCLRSVAAQSVADLEHIVIDNASTDSSRAVLAAAPSSRLRWESKPDSGIAEAMNRGVQQSNGEWLLFLQADDQLASADTLARAFVEIGDQGGTDWWLFPVKVRDANGVERIWTPNPGRLWRKMPGSHQGMLFRRSLFDTHGLYDLSYRIAMDYDWLQRIAAAGVSANRGSELLSIVSGNGISSARQWKGMRTRLLEERKVHFAHSARSPRKIVYHLYWPLYWPYRYLTAQRYS
jgi:glycosyltransferase involved in cell wall biosynthesis